MSDLQVNSPLTDGQLGVDGHDINNVTGTATITSDFVGGKSSAGSPVNTDQLLLLRVDNTYARLLYSSAFNTDVIRKAVGFAGAPNAIINGDMSVWQRNTIFNNIATATYCADRWRVDWVMATGRINITLVDLAGALPGSAFNPQPLYALRATVATSQASLLASEIFVINQRIEKLRAKMLFDNASSFSIWLRTSVAGTYSIAIRNADNSQFYKQDVSIGTPNVWQRVTIENIAAMPTGSGSWGATQTDACYTVSVCLAAGTNFQATQQNVWTSGNKVATASQTNLLATAAATFDMTLAQHEPGTVCTSFMWTGFDVELWKCRRYAYTLTGYPLGLAFDAANLNSAGIVAFPNQMRTTPTLEAGGTYTVNLGNAGTVALATIPPPNTQAAVFRNSAVNWTANAGVAVAATLTAEL
jgi:hypothetical protein